MKNKPAFKASLAAVLAFSALQPAMVAGASQKITDVKKGTKYYEGVQFLLKNKAIQGNHFYPDRYLTQEAAVQMLSKIWKVKAAKPQKGVFTNIPKTSKLYPLLHGMVARGILEKSKTFDKKQLVQRSELLEWSQRAFRLKPTNVQPYQDVSITSSTGKAVSSLSTFSLLHHIYPGTQLKPGQAVKRGEFAQWSHLLSKRKSVPMTIERATDKTVVINGLTYTFDKKWEGLFQSSALKKATILFTADKGKITAIDQLTITQGGSEKTPVILNGAGAMIPRLTIKTDNVKVQQLEVERLVVQEQAKKNVTFNRVKVTGKVQIESNTSAQKQDLTSSHLVRQAGPMTSMAKSRVISSNSEVIKSYNGASVIFINSDVEELVVTHPNTSVIVSNGAKIKNVILSANARIETNEGAVIEQLIIKRGTLYAEVDGTVQNCRLEAPVELEIVQDATIQNLTTAEEATIQGNGKIDHMSIADGSKSVEVNIAIRQLEVLTAEKIELIGTPKIDKLTIGESATSVALKIESNIPEVIIASKEVKMDVGTGVQITSLSIPAGSNVTDLITNYDKVDEQIKNPPIIIPPTTGGGTTPPTTGGGTTPPTTGGGTTPPTTGGETTPPQTKISDELDQVLDMKSDRYAVFDLTEELLDKLIESKEIESYQPELINDYRMYIQSMDIEELNSAEDVKRVLRKVKELKEIHVSKEQSLTLTPVASKWDDSERYYLSFNEPDIVRSYFKRNGNLVRMERYEDGRYSNYFGDLEKVEQGYRMWSSNHYDEVIFEKKDGSYSHLTMDQTDKKDDMVYLTQFNGKDIIVPNMQYQGEINQIDPEDMSYSYLDFDRFIYYEIPQMKSSVDIDHDGRQVDNGIDRMFSYRNEEEGKAIIGILKSLYEDGQFKGDLLIPGYAPTPFESKIDFKDIDQTKPFQFIFERYGREALLNRLGFELSDESISYPINLETIDGQTIEMKDVDIQRIPNRDGQALDEEDTVLSIDSNELKIDLKKSGSDTYLIKLGDFEQELSIDVFERFETKAIPVNKIKSKEMALEWMRRAILLNDVSSLPIELFRKIDPSYTAEGLPIYQAMLEQIDDEKAGDLTHFQEESNLLNQKLVQLRETKNEDFKVLNPSWILNESENPHLFTGGDDVLFVKEPNGTFNTRNGFNMSLEKINDRYFTNRYPLDLERSGSYEYYQFSQDTKTIERLQIEFGTTKDNLREVLRINGISVAEFLEKNASSDNTDQETDPTDSENEPTDDGDTNVPIDENIVQSSN